MKPFQGQYMLRNTGVDTLEIVVSQNHFKRAFAIYDAIIKTLKSIGSEILIKNGNTYIIILEEEIRINIKEIFNRVELPKEKQTIFDKYEYLPTGIL